MKYDWIDEYLMQKKAVTKNLQADWNWVRYCIQDKMFAAICLDKKDKPYYINVKTDPLESTHLREQYEDIIRIKCTGIRSDRMVKFRMK